MVISHALASGISSRPTIVEVVKEVVVLGVVTVPGGGLGAVPVPVAVG